MQDEQCPNLASRDPTLFFFLQVYRCTPRRLRALHQTARLWFLFIHRRRLTTLQWVCTAVGSRFIVITHSCTKSKYVWEFAALPECGPSQFAVGPTPGSSICGPPCPQHQHQMAENNHGHRGLASGRAGTAAPAGKIECGVGRHQNHPRNSRVQKVG